MAWTFSHAPMGCGGDAQECVICRKMATRHVLATRGHEKRHAAMCMACAEAAEIKAITPGDTTVKPAPASEPVLAAVKPAPPLKDPPRKRITFPIPEGAPVGTCRSCSASIVWIMTASMKRMPVDAFGPNKGESHFAHCVNADQHRKPRGAQVRQ